MMLATDAISLAVAAAIVAAICAFLIGYLVGRSVDPSANNPKKRLDWLESNVAELWQHVNELEEQVDDDTRRADWWKGSGDDTEIEGE